MDGQSWGKKKKARNVKRGKPRLWRKRTLPLLSTNPQKVACHLPSAARSHHLPHSPSEFTIKCQPAITVPFHPHPKWGNPFEEICCRCYIFIQRYIVKQKRTNVAKSCKMKMILRRLRDLAFGGVHWLCAALCLPSQVDHRSSGLIYTRSPCSLIEHVELFIGHLSKILQSRAITHSSHR